MLSSNRNMKRFKLNSYSLLRSRLIVSKSNIYSLVSSKLFNFYIEETKLPRKLKKFVPEMKKQRVCAEIAGGAYRRKKFLCSVNDDLTAVCKVCAVSRSPY